MIQVVDGVVTKKPIQIKSPKIQFFKKTYLKENSTIRISVGDASCVSTNENMDFYTFPSPLLLCVARPNGVYMAVSWSKKVFCGRKMIIT